MASKECRKMDTTLMAKQTDRNVEENGLGSIKDCLGITQGGHTGPCGSLV